MNNSTVSYGKTSESGGSSSSRRFIDSALLSTNSLCKVALGMCRRTRWTNSSAGGSGGMGWRNALHRFVLEPRCVSINRISVAAPSITASVQGQQLNIRCLSCGIGETGERISSEPFTRIITTVCSYGNSVRLNSRGLSSSAFHSNTSLANSSRRSVISDNLAPFSIGNDYSASYRKQGCAGLTLRFVYNSISDRWCVVQKPPGWSIYTHPSRPSVASVLQPLLDASIASRGCNLIAGGFKENSSGLPGAGQRSHYEPARMDSRGRPLLPRGMLREMELETAAQDEMRGLYFPYQLDADAQGLILVATDAQMNALLCEG